MGQRTAPGARCTAWRSATRSACPRRLLSRAQIVDRWGPLLAGFEAAPHGHPIAAGMPAGAVTDDTEQAVLLGRLLVAARRVDPRELAAALLGLGA